MEKLESTQEKIDLLITDVIMPELGGIELWQKLKEKYPEIKVLFISGYPKEKEEFLSDDNFLPKPFTTKELLDRVTNLLK